MKRIAESLILLLVPIIAAPIVEAQDNVLEEVVVTARKRDETFIEIPVSIKAFTEAEIRSAGIEKPQGMQGRVFLGDQAEEPRRYVFGMRDRGDETVDRIRTVRDERYRYIRNFMPERPFLQLNRYKERQYPVIALMRELHARGELNETQAVLLAPSRPEEELYDTIVDPYEIPRRYPPTRLILDQIRRAATISPAISNLRLKSFRLR